ncbi:hypothetical protein THIOM_001332 [Candidatus Thiomargarita nelsonii]|uniref:Uncharacterized protein n=1 Tax=Candidatus Thiomargarita nelsonii TaxID=1003181 RepID=A0A176S4I4_9GAMM|nr:hypothetical protein THIOM_001332 [Candidatus Thiomargarita nelsonii]
MRIVLYSVLSVQIVYIPQNLEKSYKIRKSLMYSYCLEVLPSQEQYYLHSP